jgi:hypothetical protein
MKGKTGYPLFGKSEPFGRFPDLFVSVDQKSKIPLELKYLLKGLFLLCQDTIDIMGGRDSSLLG